MQTKHSLLQSKLEMTILQQAHKHISLQAYIIQIFQVKEVCALQHCQASGPQVIKF